MRWSVKSIKHITQWLHFYELSMYGRFVSVVMLRVSKWSWNVIIFPRHTFADWWQFNDVVSSSLSSSSWSWYVTARIYTNLMLPPLRRPRQNLNLPLSTGRIGELADDGEARYHPAQLLRHNRTAREGTGQDRMDGYEVNKWFQPWELRYRLLVLFVCLAGNI